MPFIMRCSSDGDGNGDDGNRILAMSKTEASREIEIDDSDELDLKDAFGVEYLLTATCCGIFCGEKAGKSIGDGGVLDNVVPNNGFVVSMRIDGDGRAFFGVTVASVLSVLRRCLRGRPRPRFSVDTNSFGDSASCERCSGVK